MAANAAAADKDKDSGPWSSGDFSGLQWRSIGPAIASGRIGDFAVDPRNPFHYFVGVCSGGVWETTDGGTTFAPIFDDQGSYSIGCLALAPTNPDILWVGTGESNSQRSVSYGDGIYRSLDGGKTWENMGLKRSLHIGRILVHPADENTVFVAAEGPLWGPGGDRGVFKTTDGGKTWAKVLDIDEDTGVVDLVMDPRDPDVIYAAAYQRRRHLWVLIDGGPGSGIYKTTDGGANWVELEGGLPSADRGRIGLAIPPRAPDTVYAIVEAADDKGGFFRSQDRGASWDKMSDGVSSSPQYYNEIVADPVDPDRVYKMDTFLQVTLDGGKSWQRISKFTKHVDNHALWADPERPEHLLVGCDGGIYETFNRGETWRFMANLPVTQFYRVAVDNDTPFYNVYGGTQDNNTIGGPSRTVLGHGASNREWYFLLGGDGFEPAADPENPDIIYCQWQYGALNRYDRKSGETLDVQPQPADGDQPFKWNWNSPVIISPHDHKRLYYACQYVFRSDDMGNSWRRISDDLSAGIDRNKLEVMGLVWTVDAAAKTNSTSFWGSVITLAESPVQEDLLFAGTDDGLIQSTSDSGGSWTKVGQFPGVPDQSYLSDIEPSRFDAGVVFASFDNHKRDDFTAYVLKSTDGGRKWKSIAGNLPEGVVYSLAQDHVDPDLLFAGTEYGVFFTRDGGKFWTRLKAGLPPIACRDLEIQRRENDLVVATFGRGFYILDDYTPLRNLKPADLKQEAVLYPVKDALIYVPATPLGDSGKGSQGDALFTVKNPPFGAVITYHLAEGLQTLADQRKKKEKKLVEKDEPVFYPPWDSLRAEDREHDPQVFLTVRDAAGNTVRRIEGPIGEGFQRVAWDLRSQDLGPVNLESHGQHSPWDNVPAGSLLPPGTYSATLSKRIRGNETQMAGPVEFHTHLLGDNTTLVDDYATLADFQAAANELHRAVQGAGRTLTAAQERLDHIRKAVEITPTLDRGLLDDIDAVDARLQDMKTALYGDRTVSRRSEPTLPGISGRVGQVRWGLRDITSAPTQTMRDNLKLAGDLFAPLLKDLRQLGERDIQGLEARLEAAGAPYTPGRIPVWPR